MYKDQFVSMLAKICYNAQEYSKVWKFTDYDTKIVTFRHVSHIVSCFLENSTVVGSFGLESHIVLDTLMEKEYDIFEWCVYFTRLVDELEYDNCNYNCG